jgi:Kdo2-lipid IVA lauroyltransferase/acyltransferase
LQYSLKRFKNDSLYTAIICLVRLHGIMPRKFGLVFAAVLGKLVFLLPIKDKKLTMRHLGEIFGEKWTEKRIRSCAAGVYSNLGRNAFDALYVQKLDKKRFESLVRCDDLGEFGEAYRRGRGLMAITAHCGCFEMLLHYFAIRGFSCFAIGSRLYDERLDRMVAGFRSGPGIEYLHRSDNLRGMIRLLKQGRVMGALVDQDTKVDGVFAHFLGRLAYTPSGVVRLARRNDIPVFVVTTARQKDNTHRIFVSREIKLHVYKDETEDVVKAIEIINGHISATVEKFPDQWVWMHRRWKKRPDDEKFGNIPNIENYEQN